MPPTLILVRHAQALHNVDKDYSIHDPPLSELGVQQCQELRKSLAANPVAQEAGLVVVSPMHRTLQTATIALDWLLDKGVPAQADARWQENSAKPCDTGSALSAVAAADPRFAAVDFSAADPVFPDKTSARAALYHYSRPALLRRAREALASLHARPEKVVVVVAHSGFLRLAVTGRWFFNADYRIFDFAPRGPDVPADEPYGLVEHPSTVDQGGLGWSLRERVILGSDLPDECPPDSAQV